MKELLTSEFTKTILRLDHSHEVKYCSTYINIEIINIHTKEVKFMNIHEFVYTHCRDYLIGYANSLKTKSETKSSDISKKIPILHFEVYLTVPNLIDGTNSEHTETFNGLSELIVYVQAVEWLTKYRKDNISLSKFWRSIF